MFSVVGLFVISAVVFWAAWYAREEVKKKEENMNALAAELGLSFMVTGRFSKTVRVAGEIRGRSVEIFTYTTGSGKSRRTWAAVAVTIGKTGGLTFSLESRSEFFDVLERMFRKNEVKTGDEAFDQQWVLKTKQPEFMQAALLPELRLKLMRYSGSGISSPNFKLETYRVQYSEQGSFSKAMICSRIADSAGLLCDLADVVEVYAEVKK